MLTHNNAKQVGEFRLSGHFIKYAKEHTYFIYIASQKCLEKRKIPNLSSVSQPSLMYESMCRVGQFLYTNYLYHKPYDLQFIVSSATNFGLEQQWLLSGPTQTLNSKLADSCSDWGYIVTHFVIKLHLYVHRYIVEGRMHWIKYTTEIIESRR